jgi:Tfp pilus assembly protein PilX
MQPTTHNRGFVALITVLILSAVLMVGVVSLAQYGITARYSLLDIENKTKSENLASACVAVARIAVVNDPQWSTTNKIVAVETSSCTIESVTSVSGNRRVKVSAVHANATTNYVVDISPTTGAIMSFVEAPT